MRRAPRTHLAELGLRVSSRRPAALGRPVWAGRSEPLGWTRQAGEQLSPRALGGSERVARSGIEAGGPQTQGEGFAGPRP